MKKLYITADFNDADYSYRLIVIGEETFNKFLPLIKAINEGDDYNYNVNIKIFNDFIYDIVLVDIALVMASYEICLFYVVRACNWLVTETKV